MDPGARTLMARRLAQAGEALSDAALLLEKSRLRAAINRAYYAMFYAVLALLHTTGLGTSKHSGAIALFDREFVKSGKLDKDLSRTLHDAFALRQRMDYDELAEPEPAEVIELLDNAREFVSRSKAFTAELPGD